MAGITSLALFRSKLLKFSHMKSGIISVCSPTPHMIKILDLLYDQSLSESTSLFCYLGFDIPM